MLTLNKQLIINNNIRKYIDNSYRLDYNSIRLNTHNTLAHELKKCEVAYNLIKEGYTILTEVIFKNGSRGDIFIPELCRVIEILHSETKAEALKKTEGYMFGLEILFISTKDNNNTNI